MRITHVEAFALRLPRELGAALGTAGSPAALNASSGSARYRRASTFSTVYATGFEATLVRIETDEGFVGWGEAQAPVVPEAAATIINVLLAPLLLGEDPLVPEERWDALYDAMRVRGHHGGFYVDALAGVDLALWDIRGRASGRPVAALLSREPRSTVPVYVSGLGGRSPAERVSYARQMKGLGGQRFKLFLDGTTDALLATLDLLQQECGDETTFYVDALWRLSLDEARPFARALADRRVSWLEAPLAAEDLDGHRRLAADSPVRIAVGESYRTTFEVAPWLAAGALHVLQPDLGRTGLTGARRLALLAEGAGISIAPHVSISMGPQIAAAVHFAAAHDRVEVLEANPLVYEVASRFCLTPLVFDAATATAPDAPGLGIDVDFDALRPYVL